MNVSERAATQVSSTPILMFPGQSSRYPEMIEKLLAQDRQVGRILADASEVLGRNLERHYRADNPAIFAHNRDVQIGVFLTNHIYLRLLTARGVSTSSSLGLSLGEYNHLVHIGALGFEAALGLIDQRGLLFDAGPDGAMTSLFPITSEEVEATILDMNLADQVGVGLYNSPRQQVVSGTREAVAALVKKIDDDFFVQAIEIESRIPMHSTLFRPVAEAFGKILAAVEFHTPRLPYLSNLEGAVVKHPTDATIRACLTDHVCKPVRWMNCVDAIAARIENPVFIEVGPRSVLCNLFGRGWEPGRKIASDASRDWSHHFRSLTDSLSDGC